MFKNFNKSIIYLSLLTALIVLIFSIGERGHASGNFEQQIKFRDSHGLDTSSEHLENMSKYSDKNKYGIPLNDEELIELNEKDDFAKKNLVQIIEIVRGTNKNSDIGTVYRDNKDGGKIIVGIKNDLENEQKLEIKEEILSKVPTDKHNLMSFKSVKFSEIDLYNLIKKVSNNVDNLEDRGIHISSVYEDVFSDSVVIGLDPYTEEQAEALYNIYGKNNIEVKDKKRLKPLYSRTDYWNYMYGGIQIAPTSAGSTGTTGYCSLGFSLELNYEDHVVTAGHCTNGESTYYQGGYEMGTVQNTSQGGTADVGVIKLSNRYGTNGLYKYEPNDGSLTSWQYEWEDTVGDYIAKVGATSDYTTGSISQRYWSGYVGDIWYEELRGSENIDSRPGDSGGTVSWGGKLKGTITGGDEDIDFYVYSHIHNILGKTGGSPILD